MREFERGRKNSARLRPDSAAGNSTGPADRFSSWTHSSYSDERIAALHRAAHDKDSRMIAFVFKPRRRVRGKLRIARTFSGRYRLSRDVKVTTVGLGVGDKQVAEEK